MRPEDFIARLPADARVTKTVTGWKARCPAHPDRTPSLAIDPGENGGVAIHCHAGCPPEAVCAALGCQLRDLFGEEERRDQGAGNGQLATAARVQIATYDYQDEQGTLLYQVVRYREHGHKTFLQRRPDAGGRDGWNWKTHGVRRVLFHLPEIRAALAQGHPILIVEGEKDVLTLTQRGFAATTNCGGAGKGKWLPEYSQSLAGADCILLPDRDEPGRDHADAILVSLREHAHSVKVVELPATLGGRPIKDVSDYFSAGGDAGGLTELIEGVTESVDPAREALLQAQAREFDPTIAPPPLRVIFRLGGIPVATAGNLSTITAAIKTGKTAVIGAMTAATMDPDGTGDCLGFESANPHGKAVLVFDSEQSPDDFWHCQNRALQRVGRNQPPPWFHAYCLTGLGYKRGWQCVLAAIQEATTAHGGILAILIDGASDFVADVNNPEESNIFVAELHDLAIQHECSITSCIHFNPGSEKSRGHLGSQLERKSESNLTLEKDTDETTVIYSAKNRRAAIPKDIGPRFRYDPSVGRHVTVGSLRETKDSLDRETLTELAQDLFSERPAMNYTSLLATVKTRLTVSEKTAERKVTRMRQLEIIKKDFAGLYVLMV